MKTRNRNASILARAATSHAPVVAQANTLPLEMSLRGRMLSEDTRASAVISEQKHRIVMAQVVCAKFAAEAIVLHL